MSDSEHDAQAPDAAPPLPESEVWKGRPSQVTNIGTYALCGLLAIGCIVLAVAVTPLLALLLLEPIAIAAQRWLRVRCLEYQLTTERLRLSDGIISRRTEELELYRVKDTAFSQTFFERVFGLGTILLTTSDVSHPEVKLESISGNNAKELREKIRTLTEKLRQKKRVREVDWN